MRLIVPVLIAITSFCTVSLAGSDDEPMTLMGTIAKWQYPDSKFNGAQMADAATMDADGDRTVPSIVCRTTMTTADSVDKVVAFYRDLLKRDPNAGDKLGAKQKDGRSVSFSDESEGRPFEFHTIIVNTATTSTTIIITRGKDEKETCITWKHYVRH